MKLIDRYNEYYNEECAASPWGSIVSMEHLQATAIRGAIYAFSRKYGIKDSILVEDLHNLANLIETQGNESIQKHQTVMKVAQKRPGKDLDAL
jgi:hypothetical protein